MKLRLERVKTVQAGQERVEVIESRLGIAGCPVVQRVFELFELFENFLLGLMSAADVVQFHLVCHIPHCRRGALGPQRPPSLLDLAEPIGLDTAGRVETGFFELSRQSVESISEFALLPGHPLEVGSLLTVELCDRFVEGLFWTRRGVVEQLLLPFEELVCLAVQFTPILPGREVVQQRLECRDDLCLQTLDGCQGWSRRGWRRTSEPTPGIGKRLVEGR